MTRFELAATREASTLTLTLDRDGRWFELERGVRVDISRRRVLRRLLVALVAKHEAALGEEIETVDLLAVGWPGERVMPEAAGRRVRTAIWELRRLGLGRLVTTKGFGYALAPDARVVWSESPFHSA